MGALYDYGEVLFCIVPVFVIIGGIGAMLAWNSLPDRPMKRKEKDGDSDISTRHR